MCIYPSIYPLINQCIYSFISLNHFATLLFINYPPIHLFVCPSVLPFTYSSIHLPIDPYIHPPAHTLTWLFIHSCTHPSVTQQLVSSWSMSQQHIVIQDHIVVIPLPKELIVRKPHPQATIFIYQRSDPYQPLPAEHLWKDRIGINSADYVHRTPNIHLSRILESSDSGSIWGRQKGWESHLCPYRW